MKSHKITERIHTQMGCLLDDLDCLDCGEEDIYMDSKEEPSLYKFGAFCDSCDRDYGVITRVSLSDISSTDEIYEVGEQEVRDYFDSL